MVHLDIPLLYTSNSFLLTLFIGRFAGHEQLDTLVEGLADYHSLLFSHERAPECQLG